MDRPGRKTGLARLLGALRYSLQGLKSCLQSEEAFRQEALLFVVLLPVIVLLPAPGLLKLLLFAVNCLVLVVELLNSAVETLADKISPGFDPAAGQAKDLGSAAVLLSLVAAAVVWGYALYRVIG